LHRQNIADIPNDENRSHIWVDACWRKLESYCLRVRNGLNCTNCHLGEGKLAPPFPYFGIPYFGIAAGTDRLNPGAALHLTIASARLADCRQQVVNEGK
jgi:cytochrome c